MSYCSTCERPITENLTYCPHCGGNLVSNHFSSNRSSTTHSRSNWWYLLPVFLGIIGGLIAYFVLKKDDARLAKNCLIVGVVMMVLGLLIGAATGF